MRSSVDRFDGENVVTGGTAILVSSYRRPEFHEETHAQVSLLGGYFGTFGEGCSDDENTPGKGNFKVREMLSYRIPYA